MPGSRHGPRLDELLVSRGMFQTRSRARDAILRGTVRVDGIPAGKPGLQVPDDALLTVDDPASRYVSRAALKLLAGLDHFGLDPRGAEALDIGASTGGFTQVLLERRRGPCHGDRRRPRPAGSGAGRRTRGSPRCEGVNARELTAATLDGRTPDFLVADVSFISLELALPPALGLAAPGARGLFLVKPQFEAGRATIGKGGVLRDPAAALAVAEARAAWLDAFPGWRALGLAASPIEGGDGNREFLLAGAKDR